MAELILGPHNGLTINGTRPRRPKTRKKDRQNTKTIKQSTIEKDHDLPTTPMSTTTSTTIGEGSSSFSPFVPGTDLGEGISPAMTTTITDMTTSPTSTSTTTENMNLSHIMDLNQSSSRQWSVEALPDNNYRITIHSVHDVTDFLRALSLSTLRSNATLLSRNHNNNNTTNNISLNSTRRMIVPLPYIKYHSELYAKTIARPMTGYSISDLPSIVNECVFYFMECMNHYYPIRPKALLLPWCLSIEDVCANPLSLAIGAYWCRHVLIHHRPATAIKDSRILDAIQHQLSMMAREVLGECFDVPHVDHLFALCLCNMTATFSIEQKVLFHTIAVRMATELGIQPRQPSSSLNSHGNDGSTDPHCDFQDSIYCGGEKVNEGENIHPNTSYYPTTATTMNNNENDLLNQHYTEQVEIEEDVQTELNNRLWWYLFQIDHFLHESGAIASSLLRPTSDDHDALGKLIRPMPCSLDDTAEAAGASEWGHVLELWVTRRRLVKEIQALSTFDHEETMMDKVNASIQEWSARVPPMPATMLEAHMTISMEKCTNHGLLLHYFCPPPPPPSSSSNTKNNKSNKNHHNNSYTLTPFQRRAILHMVECFTNMICFRRIVTKFKPCQTFPGDLKRSIEILVSCSKYRDPWIRDRAKFGLLQARDVLDHMAEIHWHDPICADMMQDVASVLSEQYQEVMPSTLSQQQKEENKMDDNDNNEVEEEDNEFQSRSIKMENNMYSGVMMFDRDLQPRARYYKPAKTAEPLDGLTIFENVAQYACNNATTPSASSSSTQPPPHCQHRQ